MISEIRTIAADDLWLSPCYERHSVSIHFTWKPEWPAVRQVLPVIEKELEPFHAWPHWGKLFTIPGERLNSLYDNMPAFRELAHKYDSSGKFRNEFLQRNVFGA